MAKKYDSLYKNKEGWIRVVEAFVAVLLITGVLLIVLNKGYIQKKDVSSDVYAVELAILQEIQINDTLRGYILNSSVPVENGPSQVWTKMQGEIPSYLDCKSNLCNLGEVCSVTFTQEKDVYVRSVIITSNNTTYDPRQLKLFCSFKEN
mgnify:CR=1 FL=1